MTASRPTQTSTSGGSSDTEVKELAVMPCGSSPPTVTTVTPVANGPNACRSSVGVGCRGRPSACVHVARSCDLPVGPARRVRLQRPHQRVGHPGGHRAGVRARACRRPAACPGRPGSRRRPGRAGRSRSRTRSWVCASSTSRIRIDSSSKAVISAKNSQSTFRVNSLRSSCRSASTSGACSLRNISRQRPCQRR